MGGVVVDRGTVHGGAGRWVAAVGPVKNTVLVVELEIDRLRQAVVEDLDVGSACGRLAAGNFDIGTEDTAEPGIVRAFVAPVDLLEFRVDRQPTGPSCRIPSMGLAPTRL